MFGEIELRDGKLKSGLRSANSSFRQIESQAKTTVNNVNRELSRMGQFKSNLNQGFMSSFGIQGGGGFGSLVGSAAGNLLQTGVKALTGVVKDAAQQGLDYADMLQKTKIGFINLLGDKEKGLSHVRELVKYGVESSFETSDVLKFANSLEALKVKTSEVIPMLEGLGGWAAGAGNFDKLQNAVMAITQMLSKNKVSAEEMNQQLAEVTPDPYGMMMRGYESAGYKFKDRAEFQAKAEGGELNAQVAVRLMLAQARKEKGDLLEKLVGSTIQGQTAILNDKRAMLYALGMMGVDDLVADPAATSAYAMKLRNIGTLSNLYDPQKSPQALKIAQNLGAGASNIYKIEDFLESQTFAEDNFGDTLRAAVSGDWKGAEESFKKMAKTLGSYIPEGLKDGIAAGATAVSDAATSVMGSSVWNSLTTFWETNSPSERAKRMGGWIREGFDLGMNKKQAGNYANMKALSEQSPDFMRKLGEVAGRLGTNPDYLLNVFARESSLNPNAYNPSGGTGLFQLMPMHAPKLGLPGGPQNEATKAAFRKAVQALGAEGQLDLFYRYITEIVGVQNFKDQASAYASVFMPKYTNASPDAIVAARGSRNYSQNTGLDRNKDGAITKRELGLEAEGALGAGKFFSINGSPIAKSNPMPVQIVDFGNSVAIDPTTMRPLKDRHSESEGFVSGGFFKHEQTSRVLSDSVPVNVDVLFARTEQPLQTFNGFLKAGALEFKKLQGVTKEVADAETNRLRALAGAPPTDAATVDPFKQIDAEFGGGFVAGKGKKSKRNKQFDELLTWEGAAGDFGGGLQGLLANLGWEKPGELGKSFLFNFARDIQSRWAHDMSAQITGMLFGFPKGGNGDDANKLVGGLFGGAKGLNLGGIFSKLFGGLFGGFRASGGSMVSGRFYVAGENGPELIRGPGHVYNARQTEQMLSDGGGSDPHYTIVAIGDREIGRAVEAYRSSPRGRRSRIIEGKYGRKIMAHA